jgi:hypothetical protein
VILRALSLGTAGKGSLRYLNVQRPLSVIGCCDDLLPGVQPAGLTQKGLNLEDLKEVMGEGLERLPLR